MKLVVNGEEREIDDGTTIAGFLAQKGLRPEMVVVEHNGEIIARGLYDSTVPAAGDNIEIVQMMAGG